jgi:hypothetical protein
MAEKMAASFWAQNFDEMGVDPSLQLIYAEACSRLKEENPNADTLEAMLIERVAFLYVFIRNKETKKAFAHDRAHKEMFQLWATMAGELRKQRNRTEDTEWMRDKILDQVEKAIIKATAKLDPKTRNAVQQDLLSELDTHGV